jgi:hypothetical protein
MRTTAGTVTANGMMLVIAARRTTAAVVATTASNDGRVFWRRESQRCRLP